MRIGSAADLAFEFSGTFVSPESGARGANVTASYFGCEEQREEEERIVANDLLHQFISVDEIKDRSDEFDVVSFFISPEALSYRPLYDLLKLGGPAYVIRVYEMAGEKGRLDLLNRLPTIVSQLMSEGIYSLGLFKQVKVRVDTDSRSRSFSVYAVLRGKAAEELEVIGPEGGIACRILEILGIPIRRIA